MGILDNILPWRKNSLIGLDIEKHRLLRLWQDIQLYLQKDVANVWLEPVKADFDGMKDEAEKIRLIVNYYGFRFALNP